MLQIIVSNNIKIMGANTPLRAAITKALTMDNPAYIDAIKKRRPTWGMEEKLKLYNQSMSDIIAPRGFIYELKEILKAQGIEPGRVISEQYTKAMDVDFGPWSPDYALKEDQVPFVAAIKESSGIGVAPAGSGKTIMGMRCVYEIGKPTLWLTHTQDLMYQSKARAEATLGGVGKVGLLGDGVTEWGDYKLIVATIQTLKQNANLVETLDSFIGLVIIDEAHHFPADMFVEVAAKFKAQQIIGLTATPDRKDKLERLMYLGIGPKLYEISRKGLYEDNRLIKPEIKFVYTQFKYEQASLREGSNVDAGGEDLNYNELKDALIKDTERATLVANTILEYASLGTSIVITESVRYCFELMQKVEEVAKKSWGVCPTMAVVHGGLQRYSWKVAKSQKEAEAMLADGTAVEIKYDEKARRWKVKAAQYTQSEFENWQVTGSQRKEILEAVKNKKVDILFATQLAREGLDIAHLAVGHMAMPKRGDAHGRNDGGAVEQEIGRIMRPDPKNPNKRAVWVDYVDYKVGIFQDQYYSRRKVYTRLGLTPPKKPRKDVERDLIDSFLDIF